MSGRVIGRLITRMSLGKAGVRNVRLSSISGLCKVMTVRVGVIFRSVCNITGTAGLAFPRYRYVFPSTRRSPFNGWIAPVQCLVGPSVSRSALDQMLKYGSCTTRGVAGGRIEPAFCCCAREAIDRPHRQTMATQMRVDDPFTPPPRENLAEFRTRRRPRDSRNRQTNRSMGGYQ
jgi:hypothetical protein